MTGLAPSRRRPPGTVTPPEAALALRLVTGGVRLHCEDRALTAWLREMTAPAFELVGIDPSFPAVVVTEPAAPDEGPSSTEAVFALDASITTLPTRRHGPRTVIEDHGQMVTYALGADEVTVTAWPGSAGLRISVFLVVRELAVAQVRSTSRLQLHAAGLAAGGRVSLIAGPKGSGKTTTLAHLLSSAPAALVTNDRAIVSQAGEGWRAHAVPTIVAVRPDTVARLPHLFRRSGFPGRTAHLSRDELASSTPEDRQPRPGRPPSMSLSQLATLVDRPLRASGILTSVAMVEVDSDVGTYELRRITGPAAEGALRATRFGSVTEPREPTVFERMLGAERAPRDDPALIRRLVEEVACYELSVGPGFLESASAAQEVLGALTHASPG